MGDSFERSSQHTMQVRAFEDSPIGSPPPERSYLVPIGRPEAPVAFGEHVEIGRNAACGLRIDDARVSSHHCRVFTLGNSVYIEDLNSTNGTFIDGKRLTEIAHFPPGTVAMVGRVQIRHELRDPEQVQFDDEMRHELVSAAQYVESLLPAPVDQGPFRAHWRFIPSLQLGGDSFGYGALDRDRYAIYLIDVCGHGLRASLHSVSVLNALRQRTLPGVDFADPASVLKGLNAAFQMEAHAGMYFTAWYGVLNIDRRVLTFASGGHPPAFLVRNGASAGSRLHTPAPPVGAFADAEYAAVEVDFEPGSRLYVFSDGVFEEPGADGRPLGLDRFEAIVAGAAGDPAKEPARIERAVREAAANARFQDDFSLLVTTTI